MADGNPESDATPEHDPEGENGVPGAGNIQQIPIRDEMQQSYLTYAMSRHHQPCAARCTRRLEARRSGAFWSR